MYIYNYNIYLYCIYDFLYILYIIEMKNERPENSGLIHSKYIEKLKDNQPNRICFLIDGGANCKTSFNITIKEFLPRLKNRELIGCHIYNSTYNTEFNWQYQKNYILDQYLFTFDRILKYPNLFYLQDKKYFHNIRQAYDIAFNSYSKFFILDFYSLKEQNLLIKNIFFGLNFLLTDNEIPTLIMKDQLTRNDKEEGVNKAKGYTWLILFDGTNLKSYNVLEYFWPFIDRKKDFIYVLTIINNGFYSDRIKNLFIDKMNKYNMKENINYFYRLEIIENKKYFKYIKEFINFNEDYYFDFVLFYNNPLKYKIKRNYSYEIIMEMKANIGFINIDNIEEFNAEEIIDYDEINRIEKEEIRKKRMHERAQEQEDREVVRQYQALQFALFNEYEEKKLERQDTNISLLDEMGESKIENNSSRIDNANQHNNNNNFILSNNLMKLPLINKKNDNINNKFINKRYNEEKKNETPAKNSVSIDKNSFSTRNSTISNVKRKSKTASKIYIRAKNTDEFNSRNKNDSFYKSNKSLNKYVNNDNNNSNVNGISNLKRNNIKPINLREKLNIYARNKNTNIKLKLKQ